MKSIVDERVGAFALLHRPSETGADIVEVLAGTARDYRRLADLPIPHWTGGPDRHDVLAVLPYRQLAERGLACHDDGAPLVGLSIERQERLTRTEVLRLLPREPIALSDGGFDLTDAEYAGKVRRIQTEEIGRGAGSNFVVRRTFRATVGGSPVRAGLGLFARLLAAESGAYWTFLVHDGRRTLVGASPERHVRLRAGLVSMNPISGTCRYPPDGPDPDHLARFLRDRKESDELLMVVDEELKMLAAICDTPPRVSGPDLVQMAHLAHTGYTIEGHTSLDVADILRKTMFAPTVTGSPLASACAVIQRHEAGGRGYYGGAVALIGRRAGRRDLDAVLTIRTACLSGTGLLELSAGATVVRHSRPAAEAAETRAKAAALIHASAGSRDVRLAAIDTTAVRRALASRNRGLSRFWLSGATDSGGLAGMRVLIVDVEDGFTVMLAHQIRCTGANVEIRRFNATGPLGSIDLVVLGPGPGDPTDRRDPRIATVYRLTSELLGARVPVLAVCLSHQVLAATLGLPVRRRPVPAQGVRREIDFFGRREAVGFYNSFSAYADRDEFTHPTAGPVRIARDPATGEVHGLRLRGVRSVQFHPESLLTERGPQLLQALIRQAVADLAPVRG